MKDDKNIPITLEGVMTKKGADKAALIMALGRAIGIVVTRLSIFIYVLLDAIKFFMNV